MHTLHENKGMIFGIRNLSYFHFHLDGNILENTNRFEYIGIIF